MAHANLITVYLTSDFFFFFKVRLIFLVGMGTHVHRCKTLSVSLK